MPNKKMPKSECQVCGQVFEKPVGSKVAHKDYTGNRCAGSSVSTAPTF